MSTENGQHFLQGLSLNEKVAATGINRNIVLNNRITLDL